MRGHRERGATLIELIISIVVIAIAASAVLGVLSSSVGRSADAMVMSQAVAIAEAYLEEISLKSFVDPDGVDGEALRTDFDDVDDYNGLVDNGARDQFGTAMAPLAQYTVTVTRRAERGAHAACRAADAERIDVRVTYAPQRHRRADGLQDAALSMRAPRRQPGFTLIELVITLVISTIVVSFVSLFISGPVTRLHRPGAPRAARRRRRLRAASASAATCAARCRTACASTSCGAVSRRSRC